MNKQRCVWPGNDPLMIEYHDYEWGEPVHDDIKHFEYLILDAFQAGLSWKTVLHKRENFRKAFAGFDFNQVALFNQDHVDLLLLDIGIIRNRMKIEASIKNANTFLEIKAKYGSFDEFIWKFTEGKTIINHWKSISELPAKTELSDLISKELKKAGFKFVGTTICYAYMQAAGIVNDHTIDCFRHNELMQLQK